ncbi:hypothetical protein AgCh_031285 [Apium graveolens]
MGNETTESMFSASIDETDQECPSVSKLGKRKRSKDNIEKNLVAMFDDVSSKLGSFMDNVDMHLVIAPGGGAAPSTPCLDPLPLWRCSCRGVPTKQHQKGVWVVRRLRCKSKNSLLGKMKIERNAM